MIQFKKLTLHNFGSYGHAELDLQNRGFCLISGQNNCVKDNAISNGSGKSFIFSAVCYTLTGETINGIKTNLKNINTDEQDSWVRLDFLYNKDLFSLIRSISPKSDLKISKNDIDLSGKGIRESEKKLQELLPDLTKDLIASTIILGQGLPNKFSSFSPSGRKELLEKLTKSDFMIEDLKTRIQTRQQELSDKAREFEDSLLVNKTQLNGFLAELNKLKTAVESQQQPDFTKLLLEQQQKIAVISKELNDSLSLVSSLEAELETTNNRLLQLSEEKSKVSAEELTAYTQSFTQLSNEKTKLEITIAGLKNEVNKLKSITDTCPTCGQRLPNVHKPDTHEQEKSLIELTASLQDISDRFIRCNKQHQEYITQINAAFNDEIAELNSAITKTKQEIAAAKNKYNTIIATAEAMKAHYDKLLYDKQNWNNFIKNQQKEINSLEAEVATLTNLIAITSISKDEFDQRLAIIKKMDSLIRRDFRGYLLTNIISFIDTKAKDYCEIVFGTRDLSLCLNGNALDITYCGKIFDGLSGGEKQRVDLILQLAIRDLLTTCFGLSANILVLDEVTDFLDKKSCQAVMQLLEKELKTIESVFIISHHSETLELPIDSTIQVIKNENGISELYY